MQLSSGHWYPVLGSSELAANPVARKRFGQSLVFWRDAAGNAVAFEDRCPHRGSALSLGRVEDGQLQCPFHGFRYDGTGKCVAVPAEGGQWRIPEQLRAVSLPVAEDRGFVWTWRGPAAATNALPPLPKQPVLEGLR